MLAPPPPPHPDVAGVWGHPAPLLCGHRPQHRMPVDVYRTRHLQSRWDADGPFSTVLLLTTSRGSTSVFSSRTWIGKGFRGSITCLTFTQLGGTWFQSGFLRYETWRNESEVVFQVTESRTLWLDMRQMRDVDSENGGKVTCGLRSWRILGLRVKKKKCYLSVQARVLQMAPLSPNISKDVCGGCRVVAGDGYNPSQ